MLHVLLLILVFVVGGWFIVCGGTGVAIAHMRGMTKPAGFLWGLFLGPIGWIVILASTRHTRSSQPAWMPRRPSRSDGARQRASGGSSQHVSGDDLPDPL